MKSMYWSPARISRHALLAVTLLGLVGVAVVERFPADAPAPHAEQKLVAAQRARQALAEIKRQRLQRGHAIDPEIDPTASGVMGSPLTPVTSVSGHLSSKQTSVNPNFAAAVVEMMQVAGVRRGDCVAVGCSGSFPALNVATFAALEALECRPLVVSSAAASQYGANLPDLLWIDMERLLHQRGLISFRSLAASLGGYEDRGLGLSEEGRLLLRQGVARNDLPLLAADSVSGSVDERMRLYRESAGGAPIRAYINVGGGTASVGRSLGKKLYTSGLNLSPQPGALRVDSVMTRFMQRGVPVLHLSGIHDLADMYGLPRNPATPPVVGEGPLFAQRGRSRALAGLALAGLCATLAGLFGRQQRTIAVEEAPEDSETVPLPTVLRQA